MTMAIIGGILNAVLLVFLCWKIPMYFEKRSENKREINKLNKLYECPECKKYHRQYQEIIKEKSDDNFVKVKTGNYVFKDNKLVELDFRRSLMRFGDEPACPHCYYHYSSIVYEEYEWTKYHNDCPALDYKKYKTYSKMIEDINKTAYELRSVDKFIEKNDLNNIKLNIKL